MWRTSDWQLSGRLASESFADDAIALVFSPDGQTLTSAGNGKFSFWDLPTGREKTASHDIPPAFNLAYSADGETLAVASRDEIQLLDVASRSRNGNFTGKLHLTSSMVWSPHWLSPGSGDGDVKIWNLETGQEVVRFKAHPFAAYALAFSPDGKTLVSGGGDQKLCFWDVASLKSKASAPGAPQTTAALRKMATLQGHLKDVWAVAFSPDGQTLASGGKDGLAKFWSGIPKADESVLAEARLPLRFSDDGHSLLTLNRDWTLSDWDIRTRQKLRVIDLGLNTNQAGPISISADGKRLGTLPLIPFGRWGDGPISVSADGKTLAVGMTNGTVELWSLETRQRIATHHVPEGEIQSLSFSPKGKLLALRNGRLLAGELIQSVTVLNLATGQPQSRFEDTWSGLAFSPDESLIAVSLSDFSIIVRKLAPQKDLAILRLRLTILVPSCFLRTAAFWPCMRPQIPQGGMRRCCCCGLLHWPKSKQLKRPRPRLKRP